MKNIKNIAHPSHTCCKHSRPLPYYKYAKVAGHPGTESYPAKLVYTIVLHEITVAVADHRTVPSHSVFTKVAETLQDNWSDRV